MSDSFEDLVRSATADHSIRAPHPTYEQAWQRGRRRRRVKHAALSAAGAVIVAGGLTLATSARLDEPVETDLAVSAPTEVGADPARRSRDPQPRAAGSNDNPPDGSIGAIATTSPIEAPTELPESPNPATSSVPTVAPLATATTQDPAAIESAAATEAPAAAESADRTPTDSEARSALSTPTVQPESSESGFASGSQPPATVTPEPGVARAPVPTQTPLPVATTPPAPTNIATVAPATATATATAEPSETPEPTPEPTESQIDTNTYVTDPEPIAVVVAEDVAASIAPAEAGPTVPCDSTGDGEADSQCRLFPSYSCDPTMGVGTGYLGVDTDADGVVDRCVAEVGTVCDASTRGLGLVPCHIGDG